MELVRSCNGKERVLVVVVEVGLVVVMGEYDTWMCVVVVAMVVVVVKVNCCCSVVCGSE